MKTLELKVSKTKKWLSLVEQKDSLLVAGFDPAEFMLGRGQKGLPVSIDTHAKLYDWGMYYMEAIHPSAPGLKPNMKFFHESWKQEVLERILLAWAGEFFVIGDYKASDLDSSNEPEFVTAARLQMDAVTVAPYAGNLEGMVVGAAKYDVAIISMCLMSAPTYASTKNSLVPIDSMSSLVRKEDIITVQDQLYIKKYVYDAVMINRTHALGAVIGAPSEENGLTIGEIDNASYYLDLDYSEHKLLRLVPGWGEQGGGISFLKGIGKYAMVNQSRGLMLSHGSYSTPKQQAAKAEEYRNQINDALRN